MDLPALKSNEILGLAADPVKTASVADMRAPGAGESTEAVTTLI
jgi:hypothetical protein